MDRRPWRREDSWTWRGPRLAYDPLAPRARPESLLLLGAAGILAASYTLTGSTPLLGLSVLSATLLPLAKTYLRIAASTSYRLRYTTKPPLPVEETDYELEVVIEAGHRAPVVADLVLDPHQETPVTPQPQRRTLATGTVYRLVLRSYMGLNRLLPRLVVSDPIGLFHVEKRLPEIRIPVAPRPATRSLEPLAETLRGWLTGSSGHRGEEFLYLRPYMWGDEATRIDWKATARLGKLVSKETRGPGAPAVSIIVATTSHEGKRPYTPLEEAMRTALGLHNTLCENNIQARLVVIDARGPVHGEPCSPEAALVLATHEWGSKPPEKIAYQPPEQAAIIIAPDKPATRELINRIHADNKLAILVQDSR